MTDVKAVFCKATCSVRKGDRIGLHLDAMGDIDRDGVDLYRQRVSYREITGDPEGK